MWFTGKGDSGTTYFCDTLPGERVSKSAARTEALGALDELNSYLGYCRATAPAVDDQTLCLAVQHDLFTLQSHVAGSGLAVSLARVSELERTINGIAQESTRITSFCVPGQSRLSACFDIARTLARRAERRLVALREQEAGWADEAALAYLNRLSSLLYALARRANQRAGVTEIPPQYASAAPSDTAAMPGR